VEGELRQRWLENIVTKKLHSERAEEYSKLIADSLEVISHTGVVAEMTKSKLIRAKTIQDVINKMHGATPETKQNLADRWG